MSIAPSFTLIGGPWEGVFQRLVSQAERSLLLVSPFIKSSKVDQIISDLRRRRVEQVLRVTVLTNIHPGSILGGSLDLEGLLQLSEHLPKFDLTHLPSLHAKVYVADERMAIITSANLTEPGIGRNIEYGVTVTDRVVVAEIRRDFERYASLGAKITSTELSGLLAETQELKELFQKAQRTIRGQAARSFRDKLQVVNLRVLRNRASGKTTQSIFCETILFLLGRQPLRTIELHPLIQQIHPDLCDDSVDRVIDGVHFGKKWKHHVRSAQQALKRARRIRFDGERWHLVSDLRDSTGRLDIS